MSQLNRGNAHNNAKAEINIDVTQSFITNHEVQKVIISAQ